MWIRPDRACYGIIWCRRVVRNQSMNRSTQSSGFVVCKGLTTAWRCQLYNLPPTINGQTKSKQCMLPYLVASAALGFVLKWAAYITSSSIAEQVPVWAAIHMSAVLIYVSSIMVLWTRLTDASHFIFRFSCTTAIFMRNSNPLLP